MSDLATPTTTLRLTMEELELIGAGLYEIREKIPTGTVDGDRKIATATRLIARVHAARGRVKR